MSATLVGARQLRARFEATGNTRHIMRGVQIETIEGLAEDGVLHPLQQVFLESNAAQCGFCSAGIIMRAKALLDSNPSPSRAEIAEALDPHLCRCGAHPRVIRAVLQAARTLSERAP